MLFNIKNNEKSKNVTHIQSYNNAILILKFR